MTMGFRIREHGGPEVMQWESIEVPGPGPGELLVEQTAVGVNFIDTYHRSGLYPVKLPSGLGMEAAGVVLEAGDDVGDQFRPGDRVAYATAPIGAYAEKHVLPAGAAVKLPEDIAEADAAAVMLKGLTAHYLLFRSYQLKPVDTALVHAAAGGVGSLLCAWGRQLGARIIGTTGSVEKAELARQHGCDEVILYRQDNVAERCREFTQGKGVQVVYDGVGADTLTASLDSLAPLGMMVSFGNASGPVTSINPGDLASRGSLSFIRPRLFDYVQTREALDEGASALFEAMRNGVIQANIGATYPLANARQAHEDLEARRTTGACLLIP